MCTVVALNRVSPLAGLFQRAILQSSTVQCPIGMGARHAEVAKAVGTLFNCPTTDSEMLVSCLREVKAMKLASAGNIISVSNANVVSYVFCSTL